MQKKKEKTEFNSKNTEDFEKNCRLLHRRPLTVRAIIRTLLMAQRKYDMCTECGGRSRGCLYLRYLWSFSSVTVIASSRGYAHWGINRNLLYISRAVH